MNTDKKTSTYIDYTPNKNYSQLLMNQNMMKQPIIKDDYE